MLKTDTVAKSFQCVNSPVAHLSLASASSLPSAFHRAAVTNEKESLTEAWHNQQIQAKTERKVSARSYNELVKKTSQW
jgi:hypothetical protein